MKVLLIQQPCVLYVNLLLLIITSNYNLFVNKLFILIFLLFSVCLTNLYSQNQEILELQFGDASSSDKEEYTFSGVVKDATFDLSLIGATVRVIGSDKGTSTNENGTFLLKLPKGQNQLLISYIGYDDLQINLDLYKNAFHAIDVLSSAVSLEQVTIKEKSKADNIENVISGVERLSRRELELKPKLMGEVDVLRSIQTFSGVTSVGDGASGFNVRGGNTDENLILQDGALILNPSHTLGFFSLFHPDLISSVNLYKGDQPANFGGRLSSVLDVNLREGDLQDFKANIGLGLISSRLTLEGPLAKDKASFIIGGRGSYLDWILNRVDDIDVRNSSAVFYDFTAKVNYRIGSKTKIGITGFISGDEFQFAEKVNFKYKTQTVSGYINQLISDKFNLRLSMNVGDYDSSLFDIDGNDISEFTNTVSYVRPELKGLLVLNEAQKLTIGVEGNFFKVNPGSIEPSSPESIVTPENLELERGIAISPYIQYDIELSEKFSLSGGLRYTNYAQLGAAQISTYTGEGPKSVTTFVEELTFGSGEVVKRYSAFEPRLSSRIKLTESSSIKAGANQTFQYLNQISNTASATPVDLWKLSDFHIEPQKSTNFSVGYFKNFKDDAVNTSLQIFYRSQDRIIEYKDFADLLLNENLEREIVNGKGRSYGAEINYTMTRERSFLQLNYTYSKSQRLVEATQTQEAINKGNWFNSNYDKPHSLFASYSYKTGTHSNLALNFTYSTGRPTTAPISNFRVDNLLNIPVFSNRNQFRIPDYHRLDVSYSIGPVKSKKKNYSTEVVFSIYNLYARKNAYSVFFEQKLARSVSAVRVSTLGTIFPAITLNFSI